MFLLLAAAIGLTIGLIVGALGAGGGMLFIPVLVYLLHFSPHEAAAASLIIVGLTALVSLIPHALSGNVQWRRGLLFAVFSAAGSIGGSRLNAITPGRYLMLLFALLAAVVAIAMARKGIASRRQYRDRIRKNMQEDAGELPLDTESTGREAASSGVEPGETNQIKQPRPLVNRLFKWVLAALITGFLTGFFGVGGGFAVVPALVILLHLNMRQAAATSLLIMVISCASSLLARMGMTLSIDLVVVTVFALTSMVGGALGPILTRRAKEYRLTLGFACLLAGVAIVTLSEQVLSWH
ncbi:sulfite exporter TauE/SafE family protein [Varibaculum cambriense]|uniref:sulfite exporter TauE/SafE family protein n=1 Tax=Varibaculum cambriense TaxID=184870 RepID=UPI002901031C|nr:sulfite exporter TauE/SafE family protein [Varibaculum cambriense]MDU1223912.1 sulfite exporter TauE/SafE family protein [Varibaculum cambriense]